MTGNLYSPYTLTVHNMYYLNYCDSVKENYTYHDNNVEDGDVDDFESGVTMWDTNLHESFFQYQVGIDKLNARPCDRELSDF